MTDEQLKIRKNANGYNNPYIQRLDKLNQNYKYKENNNVKINIVGIYVAIVLIMMFIVFIGVMCYLNNR